MLLVACQFGSAKLTGLTLPRSGAVVPQPKILVAVVETFVHFVPLPVRSDRLWLRDG